MDIRVSTVFSERAVIIPARHQMGMLVVVCAIGQWLTVQKLNQLYVLAFFCPSTYPTQCIYLFGVLRRFQHCTGHITTGSWKGRGNQYIQFVRVLYCKLPTNGKQLPAFPLETVPGIEPRPQRWEARVLPLPPWPPWHNVMDTNVLGTTYNNK